MKKLLFLLVLGLNSCEEKITSPYYHIRADGCTYRTNKVIKTDNGIKFYTTDTHDTIEIHGSYTQTHVGPKVKEINHNNHSR